MTETTPILSVAKEAPPGFVAGRRMEEVIQKILAAWREKYPEEVTAWLKWMHEYKLSLNAHGMSETRELGAFCCLPMYVDLMMGRVLGNQNWKQQDPKLLDLMLSFIPEAKLVSGKAGCAADQ